MRAGYFGGALPVSAAAIPAIPAFAPVSATAISAIASARALVARAALAVAGRGRVAPVGRLDIGDVEESVAADAEIDEGGLDARLDVDDLALVDVADVALVAGALDVQLFEDAILENGDPAFLGLQHVDEHFFFHRDPFSSAGA